MGELSAPEIAPLYPPTLNQASRCDWIDRHPGVLPPEVSAVQISGPLDLRTLASALLSVVARHESLRTNFPLVGGKRWQRVLPCTPVPLEVHDLCRFGCAAQRREIQRITRDYLEFRFDLESDRLLRPFVIRRSSTDHIVALCLDHMIVDAAAMGVLWEDLLGVYGALVRHVDYEVAPSGMQLRDFAEWQRERLAGERLKTLQAFWHAQLSCAPPPIRWRTHKVRPSRFTFRSRALRWQIEPAPRLGCTPYCEQRGRRSVRYAALCRR